MAGRRRVQPGLPNRQRADLVPRPDIFLGAHAEYIGYEQKRTRAKSEGVQAWVNPEEYRQFVAKQKRVFEDEVDLELGVKK